MYQQSMASLIACQDSCALETPGGMLSCIVRIHVLQGFHGPVKKHVEGKWPEACVLCQPSLHSIHSLVLDEMENLSGVLHRQCCMLAKLETDWARLSQARNEHPTWEMLIHACITSHWCR